MTEHQGIIGSGIIMKGYQITFFTQQNHTHNRRRGSDWHWPE